MEFFRVKRSPFSINKAWNVILYRLRYILLILNCNPSLASLCFFKIKSFLKDLSQIDIRISSLEYIWLRINTFNISMDSILLLLGDQISLIDQYEIGYLKLVKHKFCNSWFLIFLYLLFFSFSLSPSWSRLVCLLLLLYKLIWYYIFLEILGVYDSYHGIDLCIFFNTRCISKGLSHR